MKSKQEEYNPKARTTGYDGVEEGGQYQPQSRNDDDQGGIIGSIDNNNSDEQQESDEIGNLLDSSEHQGGMIGPIYINSDEKQESYQRLNLLDSSEHQGGMIGPIYINSDEKQESDERSVGCPQVPRQDQNFELPLKLEEKKNLKKKKNSNVPKFVVGMLLQNFAKKEYEGLFELCSQQKDQLFKYLDQLSKWTKQDKNNIFTLRHLQNLFEKNNFSQNLRRSTRLLMRKILVKHLRVDVISSNQIKLKGSYLNALKVFALRCGNGALAKRVQIP